MITYLFAAIMGISLGILGGGGSILAVPILVYGLAIEAKTAIAMSLGIVGIASLAGAALHGWKRNIDWMSVLLFAPTAMLGTFFGAKLAAYISAGIQLLIFSIVMLAAAIVMLRKKEKSADSNQSRAQVKWGLKQYLLVAAEGLAVGVLTGIVGVGGGFLIVPALALLGGLPMSLAIGTSLVIISLKSISGFWGYLNQVTIPWELLMTFSLAAVLGTVLGTLIVHRLPERWLQKAFASFLLIMSAVMLYKNLPVLLS